MESLRHILFVEQEQPVVEHFEKDENGTWLVRGTYKDLTATFPITVAGKSFDLALSDIYDLVPMPAVYEPTVIVSDKEAPNTANQTHD
jgi:hypothetical protein